MFERKRFYYSGIKRNSIASAVNPTYQALEGNTPFSSSHNRSPSTAIGDSAVCDGTREAIGRIT